MHISCQQSKKLHFSTRTDFLALLAQALQHYQAMLIEPVITILSGLLGKGRHICSLILVMQSMLNWYPKEEEEPPKSNLQVLFYSYSSYKAEGPQLCIRGTSTGTGRSGGCFYVLKCLYEGLITTTVSMVLTFDKSIIGVRC